MSDAMQIVPILLFMLVPLMIPIVAGAVGALVDLLSSAKAPGRPAGARRVAANA